MTPGDSSSSRSGGLRRKLQRSYLNLASFGLALLLTSVAAIYWLQDSAETLARERAPAVEAALIARTGVQRSLAGLRGWVALGEPKFRNERKAAWEQDIEPAIAELGRLSAEWGEGERTRLAGLQSLLEDLKESQWWVEDVAQTEGNEPAAIVLEQEVEPIAHAMGLAAAAMANVWDEVGGARETKGLPAQLSRFRIAQTYAQHQLENFVAAGEAWSETRFLQSLADAERAIESMKAPAGSERAETRSSLNALKQEIPWYKHFASQAIEARKRPEWNVAQYLMTTETVPLSERVMSRLNALANNQLRLMRSETEYVDQLGTGAVLASLGLVVAMAGFALLVSRNRARQITQPLANLSAATEQLAAGDLNEDLPITTEDELGSLTESFNQMRGALQKSEAALRQSYTDLAAEHERAEKLLLNILPEPIADRLKQDSESIIADHFPEITVLFGDIVGFTEYSSEVQPKELVESLNAVFSRFDSLAETFELEKIKTIGDAYMAVGGLPSPRADHAEAAADMALAMQKEIAALNSEHATSFELRVGIHSGPAVAGVIGRKKFSYDIWGDTVNVASRMESQGVSGGVQVSHACYRRLRQRYEFEPRGLISVKGKGELRAYLLKGRTASPGKSA